MVITANFLAVALGGIFDRSSQPLTSEITVTYPFTASINTEIQNVWAKTEAPAAVEIATTFAKDIAEHWLVVNSNVVEGTDLQPWVTDEFYFLPFEWEPASKTGLMTSMTRGYGGNLTCRLLAGSTFQQISKVVDVKEDSMPSWGTNTLKAMYMPKFGINVTMPTSDGDSVLCGNIQSMDAQLLKPGTEPFAVEWVWGLNAFDRSDQKAVQACRSLILASWGRGEANTVDGGTFRNTSAAMHSNTTIICNQQISTGDFRVTVDEEGRVKRSKLIGELKYDDPGVFNSSTSVGNFTGQLAMLLRASPRRELDYGIMHNDNLSHSFSQFIGEHLINKTLSDPSTPSPSFEDAQLALSKFYKRFFTVLLAQNKNRIFVPAGNLNRSQVGQRESLEPRMSMDPVMFYITVSILGFQIIAGTIIFASTPRRFLPSFPYNLASEISFFHASSALSDVAGTANMSSARRSRHLKRLGGTYGYGRFKGSDGEGHVGIERMSLIRGYKEAVVVTTASSTISETTTMRTVAAGEDDLDPVVQTQPHSLC